MSRTQTLDFLNRRNSGYAPVMPITMMFAANYIGVPYKEYALNHAVLVEGQIQTARRFGFDFISAISDPAREAEDCGATAHYFDDQPPALDEHCALLQEKNRLSTLTIPDPLAGGRMTDRVKAVELMKKQAGNEFIVEGWVEGPCAEAADLRGINTLMTDFFDDEQFVRDLLTFSTDMAIQFAKVQIDAGADVIGIGDAACSLIGPSLYSEFVLEEEKRLIKAVHERGAFARLHICGNISGLLNYMPELKCDIIDLDSMVEIETARRILGSDQILLGQIDPVRIIRNGTPDQIRNAVATCKAAASPWYITGAGCEIPRDTPFENLLALTSRA
ncbi:MAG: uroporphyrinogen decarboxylase [Kiritimatiellaceae bacterium]|nr:uroporphyrinogen decarboxylase [Kiritimatiellaceae bacterium]